MLRICYVFLFLFLNISLSHANDFDGYSQSPKIGNSSFSISGWACLIGNSSPVTVNLYVGETKETAILVMSNSAANKSENAVRKRCNSTSDHRFKFDIPQSIINQYPGKKVFIQAESNGQNAWVASAKQNYLTEPVDGKNFAGFTQLPKGDLSTFSISGWVCKKSNPDPLIVRLYAGDNKEDAQPLLTVNAGELSEKAVENICKTDSNHRFKFNISQDLIYQHSGKNIYIKAELGSETYWISSAAQYSMLDFPNTHLLGNVEGIKETNGAFFLIGWACQSYVEQPVNLKVTARSVDNKVVIVADKAMTNTIAEQAVVNECKTETSRHRFRVRLPETIVQNYAGHELIVQAEDVFGSRDYVLSSFGKIRIPPRLAKPQNPNRPPNIVVFFTDDQGYADLGIQDVLQDVVTPNIDALALNGARFTQGYVTAPQCSPSRAAMITGQYQERFGLDENQHIPMSLEAVTLATRLKKQGYKTGMLGKWHLEIMGNSKEWGSIHYPESVPFSKSVVPEIVRHSYFPHERGFDEMVAGYTGSYFRNMTMSGKSVPAETYIDNQFRVDLISDASLTFIDKHWQSPFYMYVSHYAPHVPLQATKKYLDRFPEDMPLRRKYALAMLSAIDDGVGNVVNKLRNYNLLDNTLILFISDNGAPLGDDMTDAPLTNTKEAWNGSRNDPYTGEKGMLTEGALRVPYIAHWPKNIPAGLEIDTPVSTLDATFTTAKIAGVEDLSELDGLDLIPLIDGQSEAFENRPLYWRFYSQRAVREGNWKYMQAGIEREYLFDMSQAQPEQVNFINTYPDIAKKLQEKYWLWADKMQRPEPLVEIPAPFMPRVDLYLPAPLP